jgi:ADP-heptose:LPS heptosyltransferase
MALLVPAAPGAHVDEARRIAVLRATALGDFVFALPAFDSLRSAYPDAEIVLLGREWHAAFLADRPGPIDRVIPLPRGLPPDDAPPLRPAEERRVLESLADEGFDVAIQLHGGGRHSNGVVQALGARVSAGTRTSDAPNLDRSIPYEYFQPEIFRGLETVALVGAPSVTFEPHLETTERDALAARRQLGPLVDFDDATPLVVLHPGATDGRRRWPAASFAAVGDAVADFGARVVLTGTQPEAGLVADVARRMRGPAANAAGRLDLNALTGLLAAASLVVANDTGPLHLAEALGRPTVGIYWCGNVINAAPFFRARRRVHMSWRLACPTCGTDCMQATCDHRETFVADVPVDEVVASATELLAAG